MIAERTSFRVAQMGEFRLADIMRLALEHSAINLAIGAPDFPAPLDIKDAAVQAIRTDKNQYANTWGLRSLREAIAERIHTDFQIALDPEMEITVTCGSTEALTSFLLAVINPGDEVIIFEPFYENYVSTIALCGGIPRFVELHRPDWHFDEAKLTSTFNSRTKAVVINSPNNPTGKVFRPEELNLIAHLCCKWDAFCVSDEIYENMTFDGIVRHSLFQVDGIDERRIVINSVSKTYGVTGWRVGYVIASPSLTRLVRKVHEVLTAGAAAPLQEAAMVALTMSAPYYEGIRRDYQARRDRVMRFLSEAGFECQKSQGSFYLMASFARLDFNSDVELVKRLIEEAGVAMAPGSCFYSNSTEGRHLTRVCFAKADSTLTAAESRLINFAQDRSLDGAGKAFLKGKSC